MNSISKYNSLGEYWKDMMKSQTKSMEAAGIPPVDDGGTFPIAMEMAYYTGARAAMDLMFRLDTKIIQEMIEDIEAFGMRVKMEAMKLVASDPKYAAMFLNMKAKMGTDHAKVDETAATKADVESDSFPM